MCLRRRRVDKYWIRKELRDMSTAESIEGAVRLLQQFGVNCPAHGGAGLVSELSLYPRLEGRDKSSVRRRRS